MVVLGIDPGFSVTGFSVLAYKDKSVYLIDYGYLSLPTKKHLSARVGVFYDTFVAKTQEHKVTHITLETSFLGKNPQTFLKLGYLRGILYLLAEQHNIKICEFAPREIKQAITGYGAASKDQVERVIHMMFPQLPVQKKQDVTDAIAISICGIWSQSQS